MNSLTPFIHHALPDRPGPSSAPEANCSRCSPPLGKQPDPTQPPGDPTAPGTRLPPPEVPGSVPHPEPGSAPQAGVPMTDGTPAAYLPKFGGGNRYRLVKLELLSRYYSDVLTIAHDYIITADYKLLPATEAIGEDYESGYIAYPPDVMEKLLALDGY